MNTRYFSPKQLKYINSDKKCLMFINQYFGSYNISVEKINIELQSDKELNFDEIELYLRIILFNVRRLTDLIKKIETKISYNYTDNKREFVGQIRGRLIINEYIRKKPIQSIPKKYPCKIKEKSFATPENIYLLFVIKKVIEKLKELLIMINNKVKTPKYFPELLMLDQEIKYFSILKRKAYFKEVVSLVNNLQRNYKIKFPLSLKNKVENRIRKRKMKNYHLYKKVFEWYDNFIKNGLSFVDEENVGKLTYDDKFSDKLFELWVLYRIKQCLVDEYKFEVLESNHLSKRLSTYIFKLKTTNGKILELYFQKGKDLFWDNETQNKWKYIKEETETTLRGIPDIVAKYYSENEKLVLIDVKNRIRNKGRNSDEIYKMLGYYENFSNFLNLRYDNKFKFYSGLVFRNDIEPFKEKLKTDTEDYIISLSVSPGEDVNINQNQFRNLCRFVLEVCGKEGSTSEVMGEYKQDIQIKSTEINEALKAKDEEKIEHIIYNLSSRNHNIIERIFDMTDLKDELELRVEKLKKDHFPHIWDRLHDTTKRTLGMAECLYTRLEECDTADYAPICLEYCRALEVEMNRSLIQPFRDSNNINNLVNRSNYYKKLLVPRDLTLGEMIYLLEKTNASNRYRTYEFMNFITRNFKRSSEIFPNGLSNLKLINKDFRRKSAHTSLIKYGELEICRQYLLGIGTSNIFYILLDSR